MSELIFVEFTAPPGSIAASVADDGERPPRAVADAVRDCLVRVVPEVGEVEPHSFYGWAFSAGPLWCLVQYPEPWLLIVEHRVPLMRRLFGRAEASAEWARLRPLVLERIVALEGVASPRVFTEEEYADHAAEGRPSKSE